MNDRAIITAASNKFFPSLLNLIGSIKSNYPSHPKIYIYDLGLFWLFKLQLQAVEGVEVVRVPHFSNFWRKCYTWKPYILSHRFAKLNFYLDAGCQVLKPLDEIFDKIEKYGYFFVDQGVTMERIIPQEYKDIFNTPANCLKEKCITAGVVGFGDNEIVSGMLNRLYAAAKVGMCLGFSPKDIWKNKGVDKTFFVRDCEIFRHDTTLLSLFVRQGLGDVLVHPNEKYAAANSKHEHPEEVIWNLRMNYIFLDYVNKYLGGNRFLHIFNRFMVSLFLYLRVVRLFLKGSLWKIIKLSK